MITKVCITTNGEELTEEDKKAVEEFVEIATKQHEKIREQRKAAGEPVKEVEVRIER